MDTLRIKKYSKYSKKKKKSEKKILILGGTGFLGKNLINVLVKTDKFDLYCLTKKVITRNNKVKYIQCNLNNHKNILNNLNLRLLIILLIFRKH